MNTFPQSTEVHELVLAVDVYMVMVEDKHLVPVLLQLGSRLPEATRSSVGPWSEKNRPRDRESRFPFTSRGNSAGEGLWERQSQQLGLSGALKASLAGCKQRGLWEITWD